MTRFQHSPLRVLDGCKRGFRTSDNFKPLLVVAPALRVIQNRDPRFVARNGVTSRLQSPPTNSTVSLPVLYIDQAALVVFGFESMSPAAIAA